MVESLRKERANPKIEALGPKKHFLNSIPPPNLTEILNISIPITASYDLLWRLFPQLLVVASQ